MLASPTAESKPFTPLEAVALGKDLEKLERDEARKRQKLGPKPSGNYPEGKKASDRGQTRDKVGASVGMNGTTYEKAKFVVDKAEEKHPLRHRGQGFSENRREQCGRV